MGRVKVYVSSAELLDLTVVVKAVVLARANPPCCELASPRVRLPLVSRVILVAPDEEATNMFWSVVVALRVARALPVAWPLIWNRPWGVVAPTLEETVIPPVGVVSTMRRPELQSWAVKLLGSKFSPTW